MFQHNFKLEDERKVSLQVASYVCMQETVIQLSSDERTLYLRSLKLNILYERGRSIYNIQYQYYDNE